MYIEIILMGGAIVIAIVALLSSKFVRAICQETIFHPRKGCEIEVHDNAVSIKRTDAKQSVEVEL